MRQEILGGVISGGGQFRQRPPEVVFRIHAEQLAGAGNRVDDRGAPAGGGVADEQPVFHSELRRPDAALDGIVVDVHVPEARLGIAGDLRPVIHGVRSGLAQRTAGQFGFFERGKALLQGFQDRSRIRMAQAGPLRMGNALLARLLLQSVKLADIGQE